MTKLWVFVPPQKGTELISVLFLCVKGWFEPQNGVSHWFSRPCGRVDHEQKRNKNDFYIVCDYTINSNFHMPKEEQSFLNKLESKLKANFNFKHFDILDGRGIIISGKRK